MCVARIIAGLVFINIVGNCAIVHAHESSDKVDSLILLLARANDTTRVQLLTEICWQLTYNHPEEALKYGNEALTLAQTINYKQGLATANNRLGIVYDLTGKYEKALDHYKLSLEYSREINNKSSIASVLNNIGLIYWNVGDYDRALDHYFQSLKIFEEINNEKGISNTLNNIGLIYWDSGQLDNAIQFQEKALENRKRMNDTHGIGASLTNIALIYQDKKDYDKAIELFRQSIEHKEKIKDLYGLGIAFKGLGTAYEKKGNLNEALEWYEKAMHIKTSINDQYGIASLLLDIAGIYKRMGNYDDALKNLGKASAIAEQLKSHKLMYKIYEALAIIYHKKKNYRLAYEFQKKHSIAYDSMFNEQKSRQIVELQTLYETEKKEKQILKLNQEKEIATLQLKRQNTLLAWIVSLFIILFLVVWVIYQQYRLKQQKLLQTERDKQQHIRLKTIIETQEQERKRISKDLHDHIGQLLAAAKINLSAFEDELPTLPHESISKFEHSKQILNEAIAEVSSISQQMMPKALCEEGIIVAIDNLLRNTLSKTGINYHFYHALKTERLQENIEIGIYRIAQELISNIVKHSKASEINVQLYNARNHLIFSVQDNGQGIKTNAPKNGMGLENIRSRAQTMNAHFYFESEEGQGTFSAIRIPLEP
jgi:signal transduction histidine kinase